MTQEVVDRLLDPIQTDLFTPDPVVPLFCGAIQDPQRDLEKHWIFKPVSKEEKLRKPAPRASKKHKKSTLESQINDFCENIFLQYLPSENLVFRAPAVNNSIQKSMQKVTWKQAPKKHII